MVKAILTRIAGATVGVYAGNLIWYFGSFVLGFEDNAAFFKALSEMLTWQSIGHNICLGGILGIGLLLWDEHNRT